MRRLVLTWSVLLAGWLGAQALIRVGAGRVVDLRFVRLLELGVVPLLQALAQVWATRRLASPVAEMAAVVRERLARGGASRAAVVAVVATWVVAVPTSVLLEARSPELGPPVLPTVAGAMLLAAGTAMLGIERHVWLAAVPLALGAYLVVAPWAPVGLGGLARWGLGLVLALALLIGAAVAVATVERRTATARELAWLAIALGTTSWLAALLQPFAPWRWDAAWRWTSGLVVLAGATVCLLAVPSSGAAGSPLRGEPPITARPPRRSAGGLVFVFARLALVVAAVFCVELIFGQTRWSGTLVALATVTPLLQTVGLGVLRLDT